MRLKEFSKRLLGLAQTLHRWAGALAGLDGSRREKVARYADAIADTLARGAEALSALAADPGDSGALSQATRELGRIGGYIETIVATLKHHLDGRKLAGVKRRLEQLDPALPPCEISTSGLKARVGRLIAAEGYFRALADSLRA